MAAIYNTITGAYNKLLSPRKPSSNTGGNVTESDSLLTSPNNADTSAYKIEINGNEQHYNNNLNDNTEYGSYQAAETDDSDHHHMTQDEFSELHNEEHDIAPYQHMSDREKLQVNIKQRNYKLYSSIAYCLASVCCIIESAMMFYCTEHNCDTDAWAISHIWWPAQVASVATGILFFTGSIMHVITDHQDVENEGGLERSRVDSLLSMIASYASVIGSILFTCGDAMVAYNGPNNEHTTLLLVGQITVVIGATSFFFGLLVERVSDQLKLIDVIEVGKHYERAPLYWSQASTVIFCQFEVLFIVGAVVVTYENKLYTQLGEILWMVSGGAYLIASICLYIASYKQHV